MATEKEATGNGSHDANSPIGETMTDEIDGMASATGDPAEWPEMAEEFARSGYKELERPAGGLQFTPQAARWRRSAARSLWHAARRRSTTV